MWTATDAETIRHALHQRRVKPIARPSLKRATDVPSALVAIALTLAAFAAVFAPRRWPEHRGAPTRQRGER